MIFNEIITPEEYSPCPFDKRFLIWKDLAFQTWDLCLKDELLDGYPRRIAWIRDNGDPGSLENVTNLGWQIDIEYRGQGIMKEFLSYYFSEVTTNEQGFAVVIMKENIASLKLALGAGFSLYEETPDKYFLKR